MTNPQPFTRHYATDAHYTADAQRLAQAGWRVVSIQREPTGAIVVAYASTAPLHPTSVWKRVTQDRSALVIAASVIGGFLAFALLLVLLSAAMRGIGASGGGAPDAPGGSAQATSAAFAASLDATATANAAIATATPEVARVSGARLGAPLSDFDAAFGPEQGSGVWYMTLSSQSVMVEAHTSTIGADDSITTPDGVVRVWTLSVDYLAAAPPSAAQNAAICRQFMPADAQHIRDDASVAPTVEHLYRSQTLAASFDANAFQNNAGAAVTPGTFSVFYSARSCFIATGED